MAILNITGAPKNLAASAVDVCVLLLLLRVFNTREGLIFRGYTV